MSLVSIRPKNKALRHSREILKCFVFRLQVFLISAKFVFGARSFKKGSNQIKIKVHHRPFMLFVGGLTILQTCRPPKISSYSLNGVFTKFTHINLATFPSVSKFSVIAVYAVFFHTVMFTIFPWLVMQTRIFFH